MIAEVPTAKDVEETKAYLHKIHKAAGHCPNRNLARMMKEAGKRPWVVKLAEDLECEACQACKSGDGWIPNASTYEIPLPWTMVGCDMGELVAPRFDCKVKFLMVTDLATKFTRVIVAKRYHIKEQKHETAEEATRLFVEAWLVDKPRPKWVIPDTAASLSSNYFREFLDENLIGLQGTPGAAPWAHGLVERMVKRIKTTSTLLMHADTTMDPEIALMLACGSVNRTETILGYTPFLWAYGESDAADCSGHERFRSHTGLDTRDSSSPGWLPSELPQTRHTGRPRP